MSVDINRLKREYSEAVADHDRYKTYVYVQRYRENAKRLRSLKSDIESFEKITNVHAKSETKCYRCGQSGHVSTLCSRKGLTCLKCGRDGHVSDVCFNPKKKRGLDTEHKVETVRTMAWKFWS